MAQDLIVRHRNDLLDQEDSEPSISRAMRLGALVILIAFGGGLGWGFLAKLDSAAVALGSVVVDSNRKTVQHLEGGIVSELRVREGDLVEAGQVLLRIDSTQSRAALEELTVQYWTGMVRMVRLIAEQNGHRSFQLPEELAARLSESPIKTVLEVQRGLFEARWAGYDGDIAVLREQIEQAGSEILALQAQERATTEQLHYLHEELGAVEELFRKGLERKPRVMAIKRTIAQVAGERDEARARILRTEQGIAATKLEIQAQEKRRLAKVAEELEAAQADLAQATARQKAVRDAVVRTEVRAPVAGRIVGLKAFTVGGVIKAGDPITDVVPLNDQLEIDARVDPLDIDVVHPGQKAQVHLSAYKQRRTPAIDAVVVDVSADRLLDSKTGDAYYVARLRPSPRALEPLEHVTLYPGMPVEAFIATGERRAIDYLISPIRDSMARAMVED